MIHFSGNDLFAVVGEGKAQTKRFKTLTSFHSDVTVGMSTVDNRADAPAGLRTLANCKKCKAVCGRVHPT